MQACLAGVELVEVLAPHFYYHVVSLDMRKLFVEVSLTSDGGRICRVLGMMCFQFQGQNDIYSAFAFSLSHSAMFSGAHSKSVQ